MKFYHDSPPLFRDGAQITRNNEKISNREATITLTFFKLEHRNDGSASERHSRDHGSPFCQFSIGNLFLSRPGLKVEDTQK